MRMIVYLCTIEVYTCILYTMIIHIYSNIISTIKVLGIKIGTAKVELELKCQNPP